MEKTIVNQIGMGQGAGDEVEVLAREEIENIINNLSFCECLQIAHDARIQGYKTGYCVLELETGNVHGLALGCGESNQACDNNYITLATVDQNADDYYEPEDSQIADRIRELIKEGKISINDEIDIEYDSEIIEWMQDEDIEMYNEVHEEMYDCNKSCFEPFINEFDMDSINYELDQYYKDEE